MRYSTVGQGFENLPVFAGIFGHFLKICQNFCRYTVIHKAMTVWHSSVLKRTINWLLKLYFCGIYTRVIKKPSTSSDAPLFAHNSCINVTEIKKKVVVLPNHNKVQVIVPFIEKPSAKLVPQKERIYMYMNLISSHIVYCCCPISKVWHVSFCLSKDMFFSPGAEKMHAIRSLILQTIFRDVRLGRSFFYLHK